MSRSSLGFEEAVVKSAELLAEIEETGVDAGRKQAISEFLAAVMSARGFFVSYLTGDYKIADEPPAAFIEMLRAGGDHIADLLVKNLVLSTTMKIVHERDGSQIDADGSEMVARRTANLILQLNDSRVEKRLMEMRDGLGQGTGPYMEFLTRFNYDDEQVHAAQRAVGLILAKLGG